MVIGAPPPVAFLPPAANLAVRHGVRIRGRGTGSAIDGRLKLALHQAVVGEKIVDAESEGFEAVARHDDVHVLRQEALDIGDHVRVKAQLQDGAGPGLAGKLGIQHLIRPGAEPAGPLDAAQEIGPAIPAAASRGSPGR